MDLVLSQNGTLISISGWIALLFDKLKKSPVDKVIDQDQIDGLDPREVLCCIVCRNRITAHALRVVVSGSHGHKFTNPAGIEFLIGCFSAAWGCVPGGSPTPDHSWFPGYSWRVVSCDACGLHLGWMFQGQGERFFGLILGKLVPGESEQG
jgi:hypothetical protein